MNQKTNTTKIESKIREDLSPTRNLTGLHLRIVGVIAIIWSLFQIWYASPFRFGLILECLRVCQLELFIWDLLYF